MPSGTDLASPAYSFDSAELLIDRTAWDAAAGQPRTEHQIFDAILVEIRGAETFLIADFLLWNPWQGALNKKGELRPLAAERNGAD